MKVACNECGKVLEVGEETRYAMCAGCGARLRIMQDGGAVMSVAVAGEEGDIRGREEAASGGPGDETTIPGEDKTGGEQGVARLSAEVARLKTAQRISELDMRWAQTEQGFRGRHGRLPSAGMSVFAAVTLVIMGIVCIGMGSTVRSGGMIVVVGLFSIVAGFALGLFGNARAKEYEQARADYERRRRELVCVQEAQEASNGE